VDGIKNMHKSSKAGLTTNENMQKFIASEINRKKLKIARNEKEKSLKKAFLGCRRSI